MVEMMPNGSPVQPVQKKGLGCWFWGCLTVIVIFVVGAFAAYFGVKHLVVGAIEQYSTTEPLSIPVRPLSQEQYTSARAKVDSFAAGLRGGLGAEQLVLSSDDINALISYHPDWTFLKNMIFVDLRGNEVHGRVSIPLEKVGFSGRFVNAEGKFQVSLTGGVLHVVPQDLAFNGKQLPASVLEQINSENITSEMFKKNPEAEKLFKNLESISIADSKVAVLRKKVLQ